MGALWLQKKVTRSTVGVMRVASSEGPFCLVNLQLTPQVVVLRYSYMSARQNHFTRCEVAEYHVLTLRGAHMALHTMGLWDAPI